MDRCGICFSVADLMQKPFCYEERAILVCCHLAHGAISEDRAKELMGDSLQRQVFCTVHFVQAAHALHTLCDNDAPKELSKGHVIFDSLIETTTGRFIKNEEVFSALLSYYSNFFEKPYNKIDGSRRDKPYPVWEFQIWFNNKLYPCFLTRQLYSRDEVDSSMPPYVRASLGFLLKKLGEPGAGFSDEQLLAFTRCSPTYHKLPFGSIDNLRQNIQKTMKNASVEEFSHLRQMFNVETNTLYLQFLNMFTKLHDPYNFRTADEYEPNSLTCAFCGQTDLKVVNDYQIDVTGHPECFADLFGKSYGPISRWINSQEAVPLKNTIIDVHPFPLIDSSSPAQLLFEFLAFATRYYSRFRCSWFHEHRQEEITRNSNIWRRNLAYVSRPRKITASIYRFMPAVIARNLRAEVMLPVVRRLENIVREPSPMEIVPDEEAESAEVQTGQPRSILKRSRYRRTQKKRVTFGTESQKRIGNVLSSDQPSCSSSQSSATQEKSSGTDSQKKVEGGSSSETPSGSSSQPSTSQKPSVDSNSEDHSQMPTTSNASGSELPVNEFGVTLDTAQTERTVPEIAECSKSLGVPQKRFRRE